MNIAGTVESLLREKGDAVWTIDPEALVFDAIRLLSAKNIGALPVLRDGELLGMFSERDYTRKVVLQGKSSHQLRVREIISTTIITVEPGDTIENCMHLMTEHRIRHLPVLEGDRLAGIISIGDVVNWIISTQTETLHQMEDYISGKYPG